MRQRPKVEPASQGIYPWIARFLSMQPVKLVDQNTKDVMERCRFVPVARRGTGRATTHPLVVANQLRTCTLEKGRSLRSIHQRPTAF